MNWKKILINFAKQKRAIVALEAAIILIAFVIIAGVFSFMVINQGLFATQQGQSVIQQGVQQASSPLTVDGTTFVKASADGANVTGLLIPLEVFGTSYVSMNQNTTVVTLQVGGNAWADVYAGVNGTTAGETFDHMLTRTPQNQGILYIQNQSGNSSEALASGEKSYLVISLSPTNAALPQSQITVEIRSEKSAPLTVQISIPDSITPDSWVSTE